MIVLRPQDAVAVTVEVITDFTMFLWFCVLIVWFDRLYGPSDGTYLPLDLSIPDKVISTCFLALGSLVLSSMVCPRVVLSSMSFAGLSLSTSDIYKV